MVVYPAQETTAALQHTLHLLLLFSFYLALPHGLPFIPILSPPSFLPSPSFPALSLPSVPLSLHYPPKSSKGITLALAALQYDVVSLASHVGVPIPLHETSFVLRNLWRIIEEPVLPSAGSVDSVRFERIQLSLKGVVGGSMKGGVEKQREREERRIVKERVKKEETGEEREERRRRRRVRREERAKEDEWEVLDGEP